MKKQYETPFMETIELNYEDVVVTSLGGEQTGFGDSMDYDDFIRP